MIGDNNLTFARAAQFDVATATPEGATHTYDTGPLATNGKVDLGTGTTLYGYIAVTTTFAAASTDGTIKIDLVSADAAPATGTPLLTPTIHWTRTFTEAELATVGTVYTFTVPAGQTWKRYVGFNLTAATQNFSAGALTLMLTDNLEVMAASPNGMKFS